MAQGSTEAEIMDLPATSAEKDKQAVEKIFRILK
jgi:hypothetical protein